MPTSPEACRDGGCRCQEDPSKTRRKPAPQHLQQEMERITDPKGTENPTSTLKQQTLMLSIATPNACSSSPFP